MLEADEKRLTQYLLGELQEEDREAVERQYFDDDDSFEKLNALEEELIRDYLRGDMPPDMRGKFEERYLTNPPLRKKVEEARSLMQILAKEQPEVAAPVTISAAQRRTSGLSWFQANWLRWAVPAAGIACLVFAIWTGRQYVDSRNQVARLERELAGRPSRPPIVVSFLLSPGLLRGEGAKQRQLSIPSGAATVRLELEFPGAKRFARYRGVLTTVDGREASSGEITGAGTPDTLVMTVDAAALATDDYLLKLQGLSSSGTYEDLESYSFGLTKQ